MSTWSWGTESCALDGIAGGSAPATALVGASGGRILRARVLYRVSRCLLTISATRRLQSVAKRRHTNWLSSRMLAFHAKTCVWIGAGLKRAYRETVIVQRCYCTCGREHRSRHRTCPMREISPMEFMLKDM